jgi:hypothetical protein
MPTEIVVLGYNSDGSYARPVAEASQLRVRLPDGELERLAKAAGAAAGREIDLTFLAAIDNRLTFIEGAVAGMREQGAEPPSPETPRPPAWWLAKAKAEGGVTVGAASPGPPAGEPERWWGACSCELPPADGEEEYDQNLVPRCPRCKYALGGSPTLRVPTGGPEPEPVAQNEAERETAAELEQQEPVERYLRFLAGKWSPDTSDDVRATVAGNLRTFFAWLRGDAPPGFPAPPPPPPAGPTAWWRWIPVAEQMPERGTYNLIAAAGDMVFSPVDYCCPEEEWAFHRHDDNGKQVVLPNVTHWMHEPPPPSKCVSPPPAGDRELREAAQPFAEAIEEFDRLVIPRLKPADSELADWKGFGLTFGRWRRLAAALSRSPAPPPDDGGAP